MLNDHVGLDVFLVCSMFNDHVGLDFFWFVQFFMNMFWMFLVCSMYPFLTICYSKLNFPPPLLAHPFPKDGPLCQSSHNFRKPLCLEF
jgi:hypothetical protein